LHSFGGSQGKWTCCGNTTNDSVGCKTGSHKEDVTTTNLLNRFNRPDSNTDLAPRPIGISTRSQQSEPEKTEEMVDEARFKNIDGKLHFRHPVVSTDTLAGIALKYNTKAAYIKQLNKLFDDKHLYSKSHVFVPWPSQTLSEAAIIETKALEEKRLQQTLIKKFQRENGAGKEEASFYLEEVNFDYAKAVEQYKEDFQSQKQ